jgi:hypothetical protein
MLQALLVISVLIKSIIPSAIMLDAILLSVEEPKFGATVIIQLKNVACYYIFFHFLHKFVHFAYLNFPQPKPSK